MINEFKEKKALRRITKKHTPVIVFRISIFITSLLYTNNTLAINNRDAGKIAVVASDIIFNGLRAGIGAACDDRDFWPAFTKGALGGLVISTAKIATAYTTEHPGIALISQPLHAAAVSYVDSVQFGKPYVYRMQAGPFVLEHNGDNLRIEYGLVGIAALSGGIVKSITQDSFSFDLEKSLLNMTPIFSGPLTTGFWDSTTSGASFGGVIFYDPTGNETAVSHEMVHHMHRLELAFTDDIIDNAVTNPDYRDLVDNLFVGPDITMATMLGTGYIFGIYEELPLEWQAFNLER